MSIASAPFALLALPGRVAISVAVGAVIAIPLNVSNLVAIAAFDVWAFCPLVAGLVAIFAGSILVFRWARRGDVSMLAAFAALLAIGLVVPGLQTSLTDIGWWISAAEVDVSIPQTLAAAQRLDTLLVPMSLLVTVLATCAFVRLLNLESCLLELVFGYCKRDDALIL